MDKTTSKDIIDNVQMNHIWLNAFHCIRPTEEFAIALGRQILSMLSRPENLLPSYLDDEPYTGTVSEDIAKMTPTLYLSIYKS